ncbi:unnamed protein product, partial [Mesorhabditis spiculigera]
MRVEFRKLVNSGSLSAFFGKKFASWRRLRANKMALSTSSPNGPPRFRFRKKPPPIEEILKNDDVGALLERYCRGPSLNPTGGTILHKAVQKNALRCVRLICTMEAGKKPWDTVDGHGRTPIEKATEQILEDLRTMANDGKGDVDDGQPIGWHRQAVQPLLQQVQPQKSPDLLLSLDGGGIKGAAQILQTRRIFDPRIKRPSLRAEILRNSLSGELGGVQLGDLPCNFICTAVDGAVIPPRLHIFRNYHSEAHPDEDGSRMRVIEALLASTAAPLLLPMSPSGLSDGGVLAKNPSLALLTEYHTHRLQAEDARRPGLLLSLGTGYNEPRRTSGIHFGDLPKNRLFLDRFFMRTTRNLFDVFVSQSTSGDTACLDQAAAWCLSTKTPYFRINPPNVNRLALTDTDPERLAEFLWGVMVYLRSVARPELDRIAAYMSKTPPTR